MTAARFASGTFLCAVLLYVLAAEINGSPDTETPLDSILSVCVKISRCESGRVIPIKRQYIIIATVSNRISTIYTFRELSAVAHHFTNHGSLSLIQMQIQKIFMVKHYMNISKEYKCWVLQSIGRGAMFMSDFVEPIFYCISCRYSVVRSIGRGEMFMSYIVEPIFDCIRL